MELLERATLTSGTLAAGSYVVLNVKDTGTGMEPHTKARLFEPFFTTKESGKGTGLGLPTVFGIVQQTGGGLEVESELGRGSNFRVYLPRVHAALDPTPSSRSAAVRGGKETVLLVEDEAGVRRMTRKALVKLGYRVLEASSADEAREIAGGFAGPIDVLLSDVLPTARAGASSRESSSLACRSCASS